MSDIPVLKEGETAPRATGPCSGPTRAAPSSRSIPTSTPTDPVWRDAEPRRALPPRPVARHRPQDAEQRAALRPRHARATTRSWRRARCSRRSCAREYAGYDPAEASRLLDEIGLTKRNGAGIRLLPDGRELEIIVETDGESSLVVDGLTLITEFWREIGVKLFVKPQDRTILRNRAYAGMTVMVAAQGLDNAVPTADDAADRARAHAPGQSTPGRNGASTSRPRARTARRCDIPEAKRLLAALRALDERPPTKPCSEQVWREMLREPRREPVDPSARSPARCSRSSCSNGLANMPQEGALQLGADARCSASTGSTRSTGTKPAGKEARCAR